ncbi:hypothetical protein F5141DRAFT_1064545 [Pisolithus sp. B1]|nr:hypothetical protein F5141DRAFT_1064545 [Pisolithus sp. B1]
MSEENERMRTRTKDDNAIARAPEGIGTLCGLTVKYRMQGECLRRRGHASIAINGRDAVQATRATRLTKSGNYAHSLYDVLDWRLEIEQNRYQVVTKPKRAIITRQEP